jgi:hypothetical protein
MVFFWKYYLTLQQSMDKSKKFDEISVMHVLAMTMIVAFHSMCFYNGRWTKVHAIYIPF